ncbi:50S ribosomal protein L32e [Candidatus Woesearchaeota archaeon]|nr:50S ribosomal protein L32e [Candidatus Woesearchaeota archaeon]
MRKKPNFKRQDSILKKLKDKWIRPKGIQSKLRLRKKGKGKIPRIGYGTPKDKKYLIKNKKVVLIKNMNDLENIKNPIIISSKVGLRKKLEIVTKAKELKLEILNIKDADKFIEDVKKKLEEKKKQKQKIKEKKTKKEEKIKKKEEAKIESEGSKDEKEKKLKEEKRKVLEKGL